MENKMDMKSWQRWNFSSSDKLIEIYNKHFDSCDILIEVGSLHGKNANNITKEFDVKNTYVIEANKYSYELIKERFPKFNLYNLAFGNENKEVEFFSVIKDNPGVSSVLDRKDGYYKNKSDITKVQMVKGSDFLEQEGIKSVDILKVDVEGFTYEVLEGFGDRIKDIKFIEAECENDVIWDNQKMFDDINEYLESKGFKCLVSKSDKRQFNAYWIKK